MTLAPPPAGWSRAATALARRATRVARTAAALHGAAAGTALGALCGAGLRVAADASAEASAAAAASCGLAGAWVGLRAARRIRPTSPGAAAWALDRVAGAGERGLTLALSSDPDAEATFAGTVPPPTVRLNPPRGLAPMAAAILLAGLVAAWPGGTAASQGDGPAASRGPGAGAGAAVVEAGRRDAEAVKAERGAAALRPVREALGLPPTGAVEPDDLAARLADPRTLEAAREAAPPGSDLAGALLTPADATAAATLARALSSDAVGRAQALRREAAVLRAAGGALPVPPSRRAVVARYLAARHAERSEDAPR